MIITCHNPHCLSEIEVNGPTGTPVIKCPVCRIPLRGNIYKPPSLPNSNGADYVIYDLETTGLCPDFEDIIQIAAVRFRDGVVVESDTFFSYARPKRPISSFISRYTGITDADVAHSPNSFEVVREFSQFVGSARLIAHNGHRFDSKFLNATCRRHRLPSIEVDSLDSIDLSKRLFGNARGTGHSLDHLLVRLGISVGGYFRHDARADVALLGRAVQKMWSDLGLDRHCSGIPMHKTCLPHSMRTLPHY